MIRTKSQLIALLSLCAFGAALCGERAGAEPSSAAQQVPLRPFVTCVEALPDGRLRAHWGYLNASRSPLQRKLGSTNQLSPGAAERGQPTQFKVGYVVDAFSSVFAADATSTWTLDDVRASADKHGHRCSAEQISADPASLVNPAPGSPLFLGANLWNIDWQEQSDYFVAQPDWSRAQNPWQPQFLRELAPYHVLRFMDWNLTNDADNPQSRWTTRKQRNQAQNEPVAFEWQIDLCNLAKKDYWVNVPHAANPAYITQLALLIRDQLSPQLRVYVEWSNEIWNGSFPQREYARVKAQQLGLPGDDPAAAYQVYASLRAFDAFDAVFGKARNRIVKVIAGQAAYSGPCQAHTAALADPKINPQRKQPDVYAVAPYFHGTSLSDLSGQGIEEARAGVIDNLRCAKGLSVPLIAYEGGQDSFAAGHDGCRELQQNPALRAIYVKFLDAVASAGLRGPFMQYTHTGSCWGLKEKTSDSLDASPKYKGVLDWLAAHP